MKVERARDVTFNFQLKFLYILSISEGNPSFFVKCSILLLTKKTVIKEKKTIVFLLN